MADLRIRNVDEGVILALRDRARRNGKSLGDEVRDLMTAEVSRPRREAIERLDRLRESIRQVSGTLPDSTAGIRAERDARG